MASSSIPNKKSPKVAVAGINASAWMLKKLGETTMLSFENASYIAAGSKIIHRLKNRPVCLVSLRD